MAIVFRKKVGTMTVKRGENRFNVSIWDGNCLAVFNTEDDKSYYLFMFWADDKHVNNMYKEHGNLWGSDVVSNIKLNLWYKSAEPIMRTFIKHGYKVTCYYKEESK